MSGGLTQGSEAGGQVSRNAKTGLVLAGVAFAFFLAIIAKYWLLR